MSLSEHAAAGEATVVAPLSNRSMVRALGALFVAGGALAAFWTFLPHLPDQGDGVTLAMAAIAMLFGAVLLLGVADDIGRPALHAVLASIQLVIAVAYVAEGAPEGDIRLFFIWATPYAAFYFSQWQAIAQFAWTAVVLAVSLLLMPAATHEFAPAVFAITIGTVLATGVLVAWAGRILRAAESRHRYQALHDPLTGLPNRLMFQQEARQALAEQADHPGTVAIAILDLDRFKLVNDSFGHETGDQLLKVIGARLRARVREQDLVARMGGDEFALLIREQGEDPIEIDHIMARVASTWHDPVALPHAASYTTGSIGIAFARSADDTADSLLADADAAMYRAKQSLPGSWLAFDHEMRVRAAYRHLIEQQLRDALAQEQLRLDYQRVVELPSRDIVGAEALLRWHHPDLGDVPPSDFIGVAEETGMINPIGDWVISEALRTVADWRGREVVDDRFTIMVNTSGNQLGERFAPRVAELLAKHSLPGRALGLEVTETALLRAPATAAATLAALHDLGVRILLDDFGTGYSSLGHLHEFALDALKIDRSFVADLPTEQIGITEAVVFLGELMSLEVIAEGVETEAQAAALLGMGCGNAQGFLFGRPLPPQEFESNAVPHQRVHDRSSSAAAIEPS